LPADDLTDVCVDVLEVTGLDNTVGVGVVPAAAALVTGEDEAELKPMPFAANSDLTRLRYV